MEKLKLGLPDQKFLEKFYKDQQGQKLTLRKGPEQMPQYVLRMKIAPDPSSGWLRGK